MMDFDDLLTSVRARKSGSGIIVASRYLATMQSCLADPDCAGRFFGLGYESAWTQALKRAESVLCYRDPSMEVKEFASSVKTPGAIAEFSCVLTSTRKDRDGDVLESAGAEVDPLMPLLWQHLPMQPIGKLVKVIGKTPEMVRASFAIADTKLGHDAAVLADFGALRISHGFHPTKFEPLKTEKDTDGEAGWHVIEFKILEGSLVSIPSNEDAVLTAFSRHKLHHPLVKSWAGQMRAATPKKVAGGWGGCTCGANGRKHCRSKTRSKGSATKKGTKMRRKLKAETQEALEESHDLVKMVGEDDQTIEEHQKMCDEAAQHLKNVMDGVYMDEPSGTEEGGVGKGVEEEAATEEGELTEQDQGEIQKAYDLADEMDNDEKMHRRGKSMLREAKAYMRKMLDEGKTDEDKLDEEGTKQEEEEQDPNAMAGKLLGHLLTGKAVEPGLLMSLKEAVDEAAAVLN